MAAFTHHEDTCSAINMPLSDLFHDRHESVKTALNIAFLFLVWAGCGCFLTEIHFHSFHCVRNAFPISFTYQFVCYLTLWNGLLNGNLYRTQFFFMLHQSRTRKTFSYLVFNMMPVALTVILKQQHIIKNTLVFKVFMSAAWAGLKMKRIFSTIRGSGASSCFSAMIPAHTDMTLFSDDFPT